MAASQSHELPLVYPSDLDPTSHPAEVLGVPLWEKVAQRAWWSHWVGRPRSGDRVMIGVVSPDATDEQRQRFASSASLHLELTQAGVPGVLRVHDVTPAGDAFKADLWTIGTLSEIGALQLPLRRKLGVLVRLCKALRALHERGIVHGSLHPDNVRLDDDLSPLLGEIGLVSVRHDGDAHPPLKLTHDPFASPDVRSGQPACASDDVFAFGKVMAFVLAELPPDQVPTSASCSGIPLEGMAIVERCTALDAARAVDIAHVERDLLAWQAHADEAPPESTRRRVRATLPSVPEHDRAPVSARRPEGPVSSRGREAAAPAPRPRFRRRFLVAGIATAFLGGAVLAIAANPGAAVRAASARAALASSDPAERGEAARRLVAGGDRALGGARLEGVDLARVDLAEADLRGASLDRANLRGALLDNAQLEGATLAHADLAGASLRGVALDDARGVTDARCDEATALPDGWSCTTGTPRKEGTSP